MCVSRSRMVIGALRRHDLDAASPLRPTRSSSRSRNVAADRIVDRQLPSSISDRTATLVIALVCEAMRKMVFGRHLAAGFLVGPAEGALVDRLAILQHEATAPATRPSSMYCWNSDRCAGGAPARACRGRRRHGDGQGGRDGERSQDSHAQMVGSAHDASKGYIAARRTLDSTLQPPDAAARQSKRHAIRKQQIPRRKLARIKPSRS